MTKIKKFVVCGLSCILVFCIALCFAGCTDDKDKKYDVTIKVKNNLGQEWIFTPDIKELTYEFYYTGEDMTFYIDSYNLADHPDWGDKWFTHTGEGANVFNLSMLFTDLEGNQNPNIHSVNEKGSYSICVIADTTSNLWNFRYVYLNVSVK